VTTPTQTSTSPTSAPSPSRPGGITFIVALAIISSLVHIAGGIWVIIDNDDHRLLRESGLYELVALDGEQRASGAFSAAIGLLLLYLLYGSEKDREYFLHRTE
jgi:hypothetical protein